LSIASLRNTQDYEAAVVIIHLLMQWPTDLLRESSEQLLSIAEFAVLHSATNPTQTQLLFFKSFLHFVRNRRQDGEPELEEAVAKDLPHLYETLFGKPLAQPRPKEKPPNVQETSQFVCQPVSWQTLRSKCSQPELAHLVRSQLVGSTYDFKVNELQIILALYCETWDIPGIGAVLDYAQAKHIPLGVNIAIVPGPCLAQLLRYYAVVDPYRSQDIARRFLSGNHPKELQLAAIAADSSAYLHFVLNSQKVTKNHLKTFALALSSIPFDRQLLQQTVLKGFQSKISAKKVQYLLAVVINTLASLKTITEQFLTGLIGFLASRKGELLNSQVARILYMVSQIVDTGKHISCINDLLPTTWPVSLEGSLLYLAISKSYSKDAFESAITKLAGDFLHKRDPSRFCAGLRLVARGLQKDMLERNVKNMLKHCLGKLISRFPKFIHFPSVAETASPVWSAILSADHLKSFRNQVIWVFTSLLPQPVAPSFPAMVVCLPQVFALSLNDKRLADASRRAMTILPFLLRNPPEIFCLRIYLQIAAIRAQKLSFATERENFLIETATTLLERDAKDCFAISEAIVQILELVGRNLGAKPLLVLINQTLLRSPCRFFPVFVALLTFRKGLQGSDKPPLSFEAFTLELVRLGKVSCKCHAKAFESLNDPAKVKFALDLARFECDCEESEMVMNGDTLAKSDRDYEIAFERINDSDSAESWTDLFERISGVDLVMNDRFEPISPATAAGTEAEAGGDGGFEPISLPGDFIPDADDDLEVIPV
jgi:hypothetical protein